LPFESRIECKSGEQIVAPPESFLPASTPQNAQPESTLPPPSTFEPASGPPPPPSPKPFPVPPHAYAPANIENVHTASK
jgi:hypothetical protein